MLRDVVADGEEEVLGEVRVARGPLGHGPLDVTLHVYASSWQVRVAGNASIALARQYVRVWA